MVVTIYAWWNARLVNGALSTDSLASNGANHSLFETENSFKQSVTTSIFGKISLPSFNILLIGTEAATVCVAVFSGGVFLWLIGVL
jgi:hypothetical protein